MTQEHPCVWTFEGILKFEAVERNVCVVRGDRLQVKIHACLEQHATHVTSDGARNYTHKHTSLSVETRLSLL